jgi:uncharacterized membrane protein
MADTQGRPGVADGGVEEGAAKSPERPQPTFGRVLKRYFITGLLVLLPASVSVFVLWRLFAFLDHILGRFFEGYLGYRIPGMGLVALVCLIMAIGAIASNIIGRRFIVVLEGLVSRIPVARWVYRTTKQLFSTVLHERSTSFRKVVLVDFPRKGVYGMAFQTSDTAGAIEDVVGKRLVTVFMPTTPNPTSGYFLLVPEDEVVPLDMPVNDGLRLIISAGALARSDLDPQE